MKYFETVYTSSGYIHRTVPCSLGHGSATLHGIKCPECGHIQGLPPAGATTIKCQECRFSVNYESIPMTNLKRFDVYINSVNDVEQREHAAGELCYAKDAIVAIEKLQADNLEMARRIEELTQDRDSWRRVCETLQEKLNASDSYWAECQEEIKSLKDALSDAAQCLEHVRCVSQHCDACCAFETATAVINEYNGFKPLLAHPNQSIGEQSAD